MAVHSRNKGARGERELKNMLKESFPEYIEDFKRNQDQSEKGGHDIIGLPGFAPECKNVEVFQLNPYWKQTVDQSIRTTETPVLFRKIKLKGWVVYVHLGHLNPELYDTADVYDTTYVIPMSYIAFVHWARRRLGLAIANRIESCPTQ